MIKYLRLVFEYFNLESEVDDYEKIHAGIEKDIVFKGTNLWILVFAIIVASVGLNMNSTAVIIGAMLISPLMGPINGMGYSLATYNFELFRKAVKNFSFAVGASIVASATYFALSPVSTAHSELLARTSPTIYDVLIALFGGLAGIVAVSSKQKGNVIPGVAIATALMPPLCTAGYGLATGQFAYFFGAFYLFTINTVFIAISAVVVSQILKFPITTIVDSQQRIKTNRIISAVIVVTIIPSIYFGYGLVQKEKFNENTARFVSNIKIFEDNFLFDKELDFSKKEIILTYAGNALTEDQKVRIRRKAKDFGLSDDINIIIQQGFAVNNQKDDNSEVNYLNSEILRLKAELREKDEKNEKLNEKLHLGEKLLRELQALYPQIVECSHAESFIFNSTDSKEEKVTLVVFKLNDTLDAEDKKKIKQWLKNRLNKDKVKVYYEL